MSSRIVPGCQGIAVTRSLDKQSRLQKQSTTHALSVVNSLSASSAWNSAEMVLMLSQQRCILYFQPLIFVFVERLLAFQSCV
ncbi:hypothetical protein ACOSQ2_011953 [Xanthoceras sorbifolium]